jgi:hypothetical protein
MSKPHTPEFHRPKQHTFDDGVNVFHIAAFRTPAGIVQTWQIVQYAGEEGWKARNVTAGTHHLTAGNQTTWPTAKYAADALEAWLQRAEVTRLSPWRAKKGEQAA